MLRSRRIHSGIIRRYQQSWRTWSHHLALKKSLRRCLAWRCSKRQSQFLSLRAGQFNSRNISNETRSALVHKVLKTTQISHGRHGRHAGDIDVNCGFVAGEVSSKKRSHWNMHFETENSGKRHEVAHFKGHTSQARMPRCTNKEENANITTRSPSHFACSLRYPWQSVFLKNTTPAR